ncbi:MAG: NADH-quinone oxidoreductase subunit N, partial [Candidatus Methanoperedens sp.]|nr:NADH-quinone oxidoreductase subunit N [Candidatus Methanoperedens sp.]
MSYALLVPEIILTIVGLAIILLGLLVNDKSKNMIGYFGAAGLLVALGYVLKTMTAQGSFFYNTLVIDPLSQIFKLIFLVVS